MKMLCQEEIESLLRSEASKHVESVTDLEVHAVYSTLRTSLGLRALRLAGNALREHRPARIESFNSQEGFDFHELPRETLLLQLDAGSGLGQAVCDALLKGLEQTINEHLSTADIVELGGLGLVRRQGRYGLELQLDKDLRVAPPGTPSGAVPAVVMA